MTAKQLPLYEEMIDILRKEGAPLSTDVLASRVQFRNRKGTIPSTYQIASNAFSHPDLFEMLVRLKK